MAKLFLILVELARILVAFFLWASSQEDGLSTDWSGKPVEKWLGYFFEVWFSELIWCSTVQNSVTANSSLLSPTGGVNTTSKYRKMATEILHENNGYGEKLWEQVCDELQHHHKQQTGTTRTPTSSSPCTTSTPMTTLTSTIAWRTTSIESAHIAHCSQSLTPHGSSPEHFHISIHGHQHGAFSLIRLLPFLLSFPPVCHRLPLLSSTTRSSWQACAAPLQKRVRTPWTPSALTQQESRNWPDEDLQQYMQRVEELFKQKHHFIATEFIKKINRKIYRCVDSYRFQNNSIIHAMHFGNNQNDTLRCIIFGIYARDEVVLTQQPQAVVL